MIPRIMDSVLDLLVIDTVCYCVLALCCGFYVLRSKKIIPISRFAWRLVLCIFPFLFAMWMVSRRLKRLRATHLLVYRCVMSALVLSWIPSSMLIVVIASWIKVCILQTAWMGVLWYFVYWHDNDDPPRKNFHNNTPIPEGPSPMEDGHVPSHDDPTSTPTGDAAERWLANQLNSSR